MCDRCGPGLGRRRFLRHLAAGGALAASGLLLPTTAEAAARFEGAGLGEERMPKGLPRATPLAVPLPAAATVSAPRIITRAEWGADESIRTSSRAFTPIRKLIVHHTASPNNPSNPSALVRQIYVDHVMNRGYSDIGYNFVIDQHGNVYEGRWARNYSAGEIHSGEDSNGMGVMAAHALGVNAGSCGIVLIGDFTKAVPTNAAVNALIRLLAWEASRHRIDAWKSDRYLSLFGEPMTFPNIAVHRNVGMTLCPGNGVVNKMNAVRGSVAGLAGSFASQTADLAATIRYTGGEDPITPDTPSGNDVRPGHTTTTTTAKSKSSKSTSSTSGSSSSSSKSGSSSTTSTTSLVAYRVLSSGGSLVTLGRANLYGSPAAHGATDTVAITPGPGQSYWTMTSAGNVLAFGNARTFGSLTSTGETARAVDLAATPSGSGYWILTAAGGVWAFGAAKWRGSLAKSGAGVTGVRLQRTPSGNGYWILGTDGGTYNYGDAGWYGSAARSGATNAIDLWPTPSGRGYWVLTADGRVLAFGDAPNLGGMSSLGVRWSKPAVALLGSPNGRGYNILTNDGGVYAIGSAPFYGSLAGSGRAAVGIAPVVV